MGRLSSVIISYTVLDIVRERQSTDWTPLRELIVGAVEKLLPRASSEEHAETAEDLEDHVDRSLRDLIAESTRDGHSSIVEIAEDGYLRLRDSDLASLSTTILGQSPEFFEQLCADILSALGGSAERLGGSGDGGVDFVCRGIKLLPEGYPLPACLEVVVIGQAKRYSSGLISTTKLREFVGAATLRHHELVSKGSLSARQPVIFAFWVTSNFDAGAREFARAIGLWTMDGTTVAMYAKALKLLSS